mgnify:CR=1 FL=1
MAQDATGCEMLMCFNENCAMSLVCPGSVHGSRRKSAKGIAEGAGWVGGT